MPKKDEALAYGREMWKTEWKDMPEYSNEEIQPYKSIKVNFLTKEAYDAFSVLVGQNFTEKTKSIFYPQKEKTSILMEVRYVDES
jgi:hypothetical protein